MFEILPSSSTEYVAERGGKNAKKRAVIAVARKLAYCFTSYGSAGRFMTTAEQSQSGRAVA